MEEKSIYLSDEMYLPIIYKGNMIEKPIFKGKGNHSIAELESICGQYEEYTHQQAIIKQKCKEHITNYKSNADKIIAFGWWITLDYDTQYHWFSEYCNIFTRSVDDITKEEIEEIWLDNIK